VNPAESDLARPVEKPLMSATELYREDPSARFIRRRAEQELKRALLMQQPVVTRCVVERLCHHKPYEQLAQELFLSVDEETDILTKMRRWVAKFTTYFEHDWFWKDGTRVVLPNV